MKGRIVVGLLLAVLLSLSAEAASPIEARIRKRTVVTFDGYAVAVCYHEPKPCPLVRLVFGEGDEGLHPSTPRR